MQNPTRKQLVSALLAAMMLCTALPVSALESTEPTAAEETVLPENSSSAASAESEASASEQKTEDSAESPVTNTETPTEEAAENASSTEDSKEEADDQETEKDAESDADSNPDADSDAYSGEDAGTSETPGAETTPPETPPADETETTPEPSEPEQKTESVIVDGRAVEMDLSAVRNEDGTYTFSQLDFSNTDAFPNGADDAYLLTIGDETYLVGNISMERWAGDWESWSHYIYPDAEKTAQYPYLEGVWERAYEAYMATFAAAGIDMSAQMPNVDALKAYWNRIASTKEVSRIAVNGAEITWLAEDGSVLASDTYVMTGKLLKGFEGAAAYVFTAQTLPEDSPYRYFVSMDPGMEGEELEPIAAHYHFQFGSSLDDLLLKGERYNSSDYGRNPQTNRPISSNLRNANWYATMTDGSASKLANYNVILSMHKADKWTTIVVDGTDVSTAFDQETLKDEAGKYDVSKLDLSNTEVFSNGADDAYLVSIGAETQLVGDTTLERWVGTWETWRDFIFPSEAMQARYPYLEQAWELAYPAYVNAFKGTPLESYIQQQYPNADALKQYWYDMTDTKGVAKMSVQTGDSGDLRLSWLDADGAVLAEDSYTMTGKLKNGLEGATMYVFTANTLPSDSDYRYWVTMDAGMEGDSNQPIAAHYHFQFGNSLETLLLHGEQYNGTGKNIRDMKWYATMIDANAADLAKYNVILGMHRAEKWSSLPTNDSPSNGGSSSGGTSSGGSSYRDKDDSDNDRTPTASAAETVEKNADGSTTTTQKNLATGVETKTTKFPDGSVTVQTTERNGTVTTTNTRADGLRIKQTEKAGEVQKTAVVLPEGMETATVVLSVDAQPGTVAVDADTGKVLKRSIPTAEGLSVTLTASANLLVKQNAMQFTDVPSNFWAKDAVDFVTARELFAGTADGVYTPNAPMSRAMLMTVLARLDGTDAVGASAYETGMAWAKNAGISDGTQPNRSITREQLAVMLYRYAGSPSSGGSFSQFADAGSVSGYAADAMAWATAQGLLSGSADGKLNPQGNATRAQVAVVLMRYLQNG